LGDLSLLKTSLAAKTLK